MRFKSNMSIGDWYCKYGLITRFKCGELISKNEVCSDYLTGMLRLDGHGVNIGKAGDSGGPVFDESLAIGIHICGTDSDPDGDSWALDIYHVTTGLNVTLVTN